jgi:hypothetical protein
MKAVGVTPLKSHPTKSPNVCGTPLVGCSEAPRREGVRRGGREVVEQAIEIEGYILKIIRRLRLFK